MEERADFEKKTDEKNNEFVTCRGVFESKKTKSIFGVFLILFLKMLIFHRYVRPITC